MLPLKRTPVTGDGSNAKIVAHLVHSLIPPALGWIVLVGARPDAAADCPARRGLMMLFGRRLHAFVWYRRLGSD